MLVKHLLSLLRLSTVPQPIQNVQIIVLVDMFFFKLLSPVSVDQFLCCGTSYQAMRDDVARFALESKAVDSVAKTKVRH